MAGIAGVINAKNRTVVDRMTGALRHRGPDGEGRWSKPRITVGVTVLKRSQPVFESETLCVVLDGRIRNYAELRDSLQKSGHLFRTATEAEVLARLYEEKGDDLVQHLQGTYAFALIHGDRLLLARDRLGIKPLYYAHLPGSNLFLFASEIKAILQNAEFVPSLDMQAFADSLLLGHPVGNLTFFTGVSSVRPGHVVSVSIGGEVHFEEQPYCVPAFKRDNNVRLSEAQTMVECQLEEIISDQLDLDQPVGVTLSGGLDSTVLALLASRRSSRPIFTFTVADDDRNPDVEQAAAVARSIASKHVRFAMTFADYLNCLPGYIETMELPSGGYSTPFYFLCRKIAPEVAICLDGEGADELFGGYTDYLNWPSRVRYVQRQMSLLERLGYAPSDHAMQIVQRIRSTMSREQHLQTIFELNLGDRMERFRIDPVDRCAMAASLDMRLPYLDDRLVDLASRLPAEFVVRIDLGIEKYILRRLLIERHGTAFLDVVLRRKIGAPVAAASSMERFDKLCESALPDDYLEAHELGFCFPNKRHLFMFELFIEVFMQHRGDSRNSGTALDLLSVRAKRTVSGA